MIMTKEQSLLKARQLMAQLEQLVESSAAESRRIDVVERELFAGLLQMGRELLSAFVAAEGDGDLGSTVEHDGKSLHRSEQPTPRRYVSIFGELQIERFVYLERAKQREHAPLDARLGLPAGNFSYVLEDWLQRLCVRDAYAEACSSLADLLGVKVSVRAAERMSQTMSQPVESFVAQRPAPPAAEEGEIFVATFDGKGVPMRRPLEERVRSGARRKKGEKANKKQMACVAGVYSIDRFRRTADDVLDEVRRRKRRKDRPKPQRKRVWAEMTHVREGQAYNGRSLAFIGAAVELFHRDPKDQKPIVCVTDGERALLDEVEQWLPPRTIHILDIMHVLERLWLAAYCFHVEGSREAEEFVDHRLRMLLEGKVGQVIGGLRRMLSRHGLAGEKRRVLRSVIGYYDNHRDSMRYDTYLAAGYPIGSGVVEGACRHLVKDRMERTGMRWTVNGARAVLQLRATYLNDDWNDFVNYRIETEQAGLYTKRAA
jgi:hypothetical protein